MDIKELIARIKSFPENRYQIEAEIGEGSYGVVLKARDKWTKKVSSIRLRVIIVYSNRTWLSRSLRHPSRLKVCRISCYERLKSLMASRGISNTRRL